ncbi:MAG: hypothetical protein ABIF19_11330 [Planctomycetota bacterium]
MRITSVVAVILAGIFFVFPVLYGVRRDERIGKVLSSPGTAEQFRSAKGDNTKGTQNRTSPLVQQAEAFASFLNPKPAVMKTSPTVTKAGSPRILPATTPKFDVFATSYCPQSPQLSLALIDEPGRGRRWVRKSSMVGHVLIEEVKDGLVVVKSGDKTFEVPLKQTKETDLPKGKTAAAAATSQGRIKAALPTARRTYPSITRPPSGSPQPSESDDEDSRADELITRLEDLQKTTAVPGGEERAARIAELISKVKSTRVSTEDAQRLTSLGEKLQDTSRDPNQSPSALKNGKLMKSSPTTEPPEEK